MENYLLSVIVPIYNVELYIERCIESLINQQQNAIEIILVDDGSPDRCPAICDDYEKKYENIKVIHKKNEGLGLARNSGIQIAKGKYIAFVDSDDYVEEDFYKILLEKALEDDLDVCLAGSYIFDNDGELNVVRATDEELCEKMLTGSNVRTLGAKVISANENGKDYLTASAWSGIFKRSLFSKNKLLFPSERIFISEDVGFDLDLYQICTSVYVCDMAGYHYCYNGKSLSRGYKANRFELLIETCEEMEKRLQQYAMYNERYRVALYFWVNFEKCINQEVRYRTKSEQNIIYNNIKKMLENSLVNDYLSILKAVHRLPKLQMLLCALLSSKKICSVIWLLRIYNRVKHKGDR